MLTMAEAPAVPEIRAQNVRQSAALRAVRKRDFTGTVIPFTAEVSMKTDTAMGPVTVQEAVHTAVPGRSALAGTVITDIAETEFPAAFRRYAPGLNGKKRQPAFPALLLGSRLLFFLCTAFHFYSFCCTFLSAAQPAASPASPGRIHPSPRL